ncbi:protein of unknown function (plasmid) [Cupriavidus taiwanensis]|uniref:Uncharacterized protein n=1 Tax=Cupriavidus taiwanensis TaxID=164546 RepID=A0A375EEX4_9BURK|nr:protein of unknown function [Cupriavidus taiwanensis]SOZ74624.1 protein of unknown function [Cupriavidus taiwanensis]
MNCTPKVDPTLGCFSWLRYDERFKPASSHELQPDNTTCEILEDVLSRSTVNSVFVTLAQANVYLQIHHLPIWMSR